MEKSASHESQFVPIEPSDPERVTHDAEYWRARARKTRAEAARMSDAISRQAMERIAASYDQLGDWADVKRR